MSTSSVPIATMRRVDARVGAPLCFVLTFLRRIFGRSAPPEGPPERILILKLAEQGATVAAHRALERAVELVGRDHVHVAVFAQNRFVLDELAIIPPEQVIAVRATSPTRVVIDLLRLIRRSRKLGVDAVVDLEFFSRVTAIIAFLTGAPRRVGLHGFSGEGPYRGDLLTHRISANPLQHVSHTFLALVEALDQPAERLPALDVGPWERDDPPRIVPTPAELDRVTRLVTDSLDVAALPRLILLNANTGDLVPLRRWPVERYVDLAHRILERHPDAAIVLTGAPDEAPAVDAVAERIGSERCVSLAGKTTMRELLVLYDIAEVMVTNDSGPAHYAGMTGIDVIALFGPETPAVFGPLGARSHAVWAELPCSPCVNAYNNRLSPCRNNLCMQRITVDEVDSLVEERLADRVHAG